MSKMLDATCAGGVVSVAGVIVPTADILSQGVKDSDGVLMIDQDNAKYITSNATDIKDLIEGIVSIVEKMVEIATSLDAVTVTPGTAAANIALLTAMKTELDATKDNLK